MQQTTIIKPDSRFDIGFLQSFILMLKNLFHHRELAVQFFKREFFAEYKRSFIGSAWILISPVAGILSWVFLQKTNILDPGDIEIPYPAYVLIGTMVWGLFMSVYSAVSTALYTSHYLITHAQFPHEVIFFVNVIVKVVHFFITFTLTILVFLLFGIIPSYGLILLPIVLFPLLLTASSVGLIVSVISIVSYDFHKLITGIMGLLMYITPVIYSADVIENRLIRKIVSLNPLTHLVCSARDIFFYGRLYSPAEFLLYSFLSFILFIIAWRIFFVTENKIIERML